jgi:hypothetical protein
VQRRRGRRAAGQHERPQRAQLSIHGVDLVLEALDLHFAHAQTLAGTLRSTLRHGQIGADVEEIVLDATQHSVDVGVLVAHVEAGDADRCVGFVDRAVGGYARRVLGYAFPGAERGGASIARAGVDLIENHHDAYLTRLAASPRPG